MKMVGSLGFRRKNPYLVGAGGESPISLQIQKQAMKKLRLFCCMLIAMSLLMLTGCQVTPEGAWEKFEALPFQGYDLITSATSESSTDDCHSVLIEAVYYTPHSFDDVLQEVERELLSHDWVKVGEERTVNDLNQYASFELSDEAYITVRSQVIPNPHLEHEKDEYISLQSLVLDPPIDNDNIGDGYFLIRFHYNPYPPNNCGG